MYIWQDELRAVCPLIRMGRGSMMGVDQNRNHGMGRRIRRFSSCCRRLMKSDTGNCVFL